jgi:hypothetical protein
MRKCEIYIVIFYQICSSLLFLTCKNHFLNNMNMHNNTLLSITLVIIRMSVGFITIYMRVSIESIYVRTICLC